MRDSAPGREGIDIWGHLACRHGQCLEMYWMFPLLLYVVSPDQRLLVPAWAKQCHGHAEIPYREDSVSCCPPLLLVQQAGEFPRGNIPVLGQNTLHSVVVSLTWECGRLFSQQGILSESSWSGKEISTTGKKSRKEPPRWRILSSHEIYFPIDKLKMF